MAQVEKEKKNGNNLRTMMRLPTMFEGSNRSSTYRSEGEHAKKGYTFCRSTSPNILKKAKLQQLTRATAVARSCVHYLFTPERRLS